MNDYLYDSARVRSLEHSLIGRDGIEQLLATKSVEEMILRLGEMGVDAVTDTDGHFLREETLLQILRNAYGELREAISRNPELSLWLYPYDCNNVKAAIKGFVRKIDPRSMMFDFGTVEIEDVIRMVENGVFPTFPKEMQRVAPIAMAAYAKHRDPQRIDLLLDRACYADMLSAAKNRKSGKIWIAKTAGTWDTKIILSLHCSIVKPAVQLLLKYGSIRQMIHLFIPDGFCGIAPSTAKIISCRSAIPRWLRDSRRKSQRKRAFSKLPATTLSKMRKRSFRR